MRKFWIVFEWFICEYVVLRNSSTLFNDYALKIPQTGYSTPQWIASVFFFLLFAWLFWDECLRRDHRKLTDILIIEQMSPNILNRFRSSPGFIPKDTIKFERWSTNLMLLGIWTVIVLSITDYFLFHTFTGGIPSPVMSIIGLVLFVFGATLNLKAGYDLGNSYIDEILIFESQVLITKGLYSSVRHPMYLGMTIILIATCITFGSVLGFISLIVLYLPILMYRVRVEEAMLKEHFKDDYKASFTDKKRLIPSLI